MKTILILFTIIMSTELAFSYEPSDCGKSLKDGFFPENRVTSKSFFNISPSRFEILMTNLEESYQPLFKKRNKRLIIKKDWNCDKANAYATRGQLREEGRVPLDEAIVIVNGGLAKYPMMTEDALLLVVCHEIGHHIGGSPKKMRGNSHLVDWSAAEGQADYFATTKCLKKIFAEIEFSSVNEKETIDKNVEVEKICSNDKICIRSIQAGLITAKVYASITNSYSAPIGLTNRDRSEVYTTLLTHPRPQCRLDTMVAGTICPVDHTTSFDEADSSKGACLKSAMDINEKNGARPACWFKE